MKPAIELFQECRRNTFAAFSAGAQSCIFYALVLNRDRTHLITLGALFFEVGK